MSGRRNINTGIGLGKHEPGLNYFKANENIMIRRCIRNTYPSIWKNEVGLRFGSVEGSPLD